MTGREITMRRRSWNLKPKENRVEKKKREARCRERGQVKRPRPLLPRVQFSSSKNVSFTKTFHKLTHLFNDKRSKPGSFLDDPQSLKCEHLTRREGENNFSCS